MEAVDLDTLSPVLEMNHNSSMRFLRNEPYLIRVTVKASPDHETLDVRPHWHDTHDELFRVIKGRLEVTIGSTTRVYTAEDDIIFIPRGTVHSLRAFQGEETVIEEKTEPMDLDKELFFRNLMKDGKAPTMSDFLNIMVVSYHGDMRPGLPGHIKWLERGLVTIIGGYIAPLLGYKVKYDSYKKSV